MLVKNRLLDAHFEVRELQRLLLEAQQRERKIVKSLGRQGWFDWFWEACGY